MEMRLTPDLWLRTIPCENGVWLGEWRKLQTTDQYRELIDLISFVPYEVVEHAIRGYTNPLENALGPPPEACLLVMSHEECAEKKHCAMYNPERCYPCFKAPICFDLEFRSLETAPLIRTVLRSWIDHYYVVATEEVITAWNPPHFST